jgi:hypothetical protein
MMLICGLAGYQFVESYQILSIFLFSFFFLLKFLQFPSFYLLIPQLIHLSVSLCSNKIWKQLSPLRNLKFIYITSQSALWVDLGARRGGWSTPRPDGVSHKKTAPVSTVQEAGWDPRPVRTDTEKTKSLIPTGTGTPRRRVRVESLKRLCYPGSAPL